MTDDDLRRLMGMNLPLDRLSAAEFDALAHRIKTSCPEHRSRLEALLLQDLLSRPDGARLVDLASSNHEPEPRVASTAKNVPSKVLQALALIVIAVHSLAVTIVLLRLLHP